MLDDARWPMADAPVTVFDNNNISASSNTTNHSP